MPEPLLIKDLKEQIENLDDNLPVYVSRDEEGNGFKRLWDISPCLFNTEDEYPIHPDDEDKYKEGSKIIRAVVLWP
jgi:hypothetical protein